MTEHKRDGPQIEKNAAAPFPADSRGVGRFEEVLLQKSRDSRLGKRMRTRFLFLTIVAQCIQNDSAKDPTLEDVLERSGLARSTFYTNFKDVAECVTEVLTLFFESLGESRGITERELSSYQAILEANTWYCRSYEANAGLFAGVARNPTVLKMREAQNASWARKIVHVSERRRGVPFTQAIRKEYTGIVGILIVMTTEAARERFVTKDKLLVSTYRTADALAESLTSIWYRMTIGYEQSQTLTRRS